MFILSLYPRYIGYYPQVKD